MARLALVAFAPQQSHEVLARAAAARAPGQVDEQSEVLAPQQLGWSVHAVDRDACGPEHPTVDAGEGRHRAGLSGCVRRRASADRFSTRMQPPDSADVQRAIGDRYVLLALVGAGR